MALPFSFPMSLRRLDSETTVGAEAGVPSKIELEE